MQFEIHACALHILFFFFKLAEWVRKEWQHLLLRPICAFDVYLVLCYHMLLKYFRSPPSHT